MQTITLQAEKSVIDEILEFIKDKNAKFIIEKDDNFSNLTFDEIKAEVKDTIEQIENGTMELYTMEEIRTYTDKIINS
ncbi:hypothetical protein [Campylobacter ureolyticus]|uniref:Uncharacterized protein n=1 Tax=Campylobacter ureolyticus TaxID=827 RepID=A0A9Q4PX54_9BACT|nr:hypothetical protein [Campylobacter ureolyticus]MCZ6102979.1 hypothetical protein [Campylobacter ureolyticus]MCZ6134261.1 hypothetical protein [Campylobacter ureolyticus]MCZ6161305.1 hypothetical protein [Campylobacter ureolyticus]MCZ6170411.1 hypothetical protein [Campylobacter ureolyticus]MCZ6174435.1 hypothetical protein [Campylobacter ureolyticus]